MTKLLQCDSKNKRSGEKFYLKVKYLFRLNFLVDDKYSALPRDLFSFSTSKSCIFYFSNKHNFRVFYRSRLTEKLPMSTICSE